MEIILTPNQKSHRRCTSLKKEKSQLSLEFAKLKVYLKEIPEN